MPAAYCLIRSEPVYRADAFHAGLRACGYEVRTAAPAQFGADDVLVTWNRYGDMHALALRAEAAGVPVLIAENGFLGPGGISPVLMNPRSVYALARGYHNDASVVPEGPGDRWDALGVNLAPWRASGGHVLICPNRSFGTPGRMMPPDWANDVRKRLAKLTKREVRLRPHPGNDAPRKPLADDLRDCWAVVIWASSAGVHALVAGVPVICEAPAWICRDAAAWMLEFAVDPVMPAETREKALHRLAWAQWSLAEIEDGTAFREVLG